MELDPYIYTIDNSRIFEYYIINRYTCKRYIRKGGMMKHTEQDPEALLPLTPAVFSILLALADGEQRMGPGTLYGSIKRMLNDGLIAESGERPDPTLDDERRRYYRLTSFGQRVAQAEAQRLEQLLRVAHLKNLLPGLDSTGGVA